MTPDTPHQPYPPESAEQPVPTEPSCADAVDHERRGFVIGGLAAVPVLAAGCGGGGGDDAEAAADSPAARVATPQSVAVTAVPSVPQAAGRFQTLHRPTVGLLGSTVLSLPPGQDAAATSAFWIVIDAGTDARAVAVMAGSSAEADRLELRLDASQGTALRLRTGRPLVGVYVARAGQSGYTMAAGADIAGSGVLRWDFQSIDRIQALEILVHPGTGGDAITLECLGTAL